jgi:hypothetical protein
MVDFTAVLKNTIDGLGDFSPAIREIVYQRARATLAARLAAVGPPPAAVAERQRRALEDAIAEVESSYFDEVDDDPIADLANIFDHARLPEANETAVLDVVPSTEGAGSTLQAEGPADEPSDPPAPLNAAANEADETQRLLELAPPAGPREPPEPPIVKVADFRPAPLNAAANEADEHLLELAPPADPREPPEPPVVEVADFQVLGEASASLGNELVEVQSAGGNTMDFGAIRLNTLTMESAHQLGWGSSGLCSLCQRWAVCIDQTSCWHRTTSSE